MIHLLSLGCRNRFELWLHYLTAEMPLLTFQASISSTNWEELVCIERVNHDLIIRRVPGSSENPHVLCVVVGMMGSGHVTVVALVVVISGALEFARTRSFTYNPALSGARFCKVRSANQQKQPQLQVKTPHSLLPDLGLRICTVARSPGDLLADYGLRSCWASGRSLGW